MARSQAPAFVVASFMTLLALVLNYFYSSTKLSVYLFSFLYLLLLPSAALLHWSFHQETIELLLEAFFFGTVSPAADQIYLENDHSEHKTMFTVYQAFFFIYSEKYFLSQTLKTHEFVVLFRPKRWFQSYKMYFKISFKNSILKFHSHKEGSWKQNSYLVLSLTRWEGG